LQTIDDFGSVVLAAIEGQEATVREIEWFYNAQPAGVTLFSRNLSSFPQIQSLTNSLQNTRKPGTPPLIIAIDQEGGRVSRLPKPFPDLGPCQKLFPGISDSSLSKIRSYGRSVGDKLIELGINTNFAPVCDILTNQNNKAIGDRVFGTTTSEATPRAEAFLEGQKSSGVISCLKHFPGQGDADADTHLRPSQIKLQISDLEKRELVPFRHLANKAELVMISHCIYPALCDKPASLSNKVINKLLRTDLGFDGIVVSDDMNMKALPQDQKGWEWAITESLAAGSNLVLVCKDIDRCRRAVASIKDRAETEERFRAQVKESSTKLYKLRKSLAN
tara:strand:- start:217 stop:1215 length:999 start_codon:yes stop_codon:yes gene_type:complete